MEDVCRTSSPRLHYFLTGNKSSPQQQSHLFQYFSHFLTVILPFSCHLLLYLIAYLLIAFLYCTQIKCVCVCVRVRAHHTCSGAFLKSLAVSSSKCLITLGRNCCTEPGFSETSRVNIITMMKLKKKSINCYSAGGVTGEKMNGQKRTEGFCPLCVPFY